MSINASVPKNPMTKFLKFSEREQRGREYYVCRANFRRFTLANVLAILFGFLCMVVPGVILLLYFSLRKLKTSYGFATITSDRVIYYEYNEHPEVNYRAVRQANLKDISAVKLEIANWPWRQQFVFTVWTPSALALAVGAERGLLSFLSFGNQLEPGPDADDFVQQLGTLIASKRSRFSTASA